MTKPLNRTFELLAETRNPAAVDLMVSALDAPARSDRTAVDSTIIDLVNRLYEHLKYGKEVDDTALYLRDADRIRHQMLAALEAAAYRYPFHRCRQVIDFFKIPAAPENMH